MDFFLTYYRAHLLMNKLNNWNDEATRCKKYQHSLIDQNIIVDFVHDMLLDDDAKLHDEK